MDTINDLLKNNGQLHTAIVDAKKTLTITAENMDINVESVLSNSEDENGLQFNLRNAISSAAFQEKILSCLNNTWQFLPRNDAVYLYLFV